MDTTTLLSQIIKQNKTRIFRIDFMPVEYGFRSDIDVMTIVGIKRPTTDDNAHVAVLDFKTKKTYAIPYEDITQLNVRKFQLAV
jgi:hypothetical protein